MPAQQNEYVIFGVKFDISEYQKKAVDLEKTATKLKKQQKELADEVKTYEKGLKEGTVSTEQYNKKQQEFAERSVKLKKEIRDTSTAQRENARTIDLVTKATDANADSYEKLLREHQLAQTQLKLMEGTLKRNEDGTIELTEEYEKQAAVVRKAKDAIIEFDQGIKDGRSNVGNYTTSMKDAIEQSGFFSDEIIKAREVMNKLSAAGTIAKASIMGNVSALKLLRVALAATGIGLVVLALGGLISFLTKTQEGIDWVSQKTKGLQTVLGVLTDKLSAVGEKIFKAFDNPKQAISDLIDLIGENLMNRVRALMVIWDGLKSGDFNKTQEGLLQLTTGIEDAAGKAKQLAKELNNSRKAAEDIEKENQRIRDAEIALNRERDISRTKVKELNMIAEDTNKSTAERAAAAKRALEIEQGLLNKQLQLQQERVENLRAEKGLTNSLASDNREVAEAEGQLARLRAESLELQTTLNNKLNTILKEGARIEQDRLKMVKERAKRDARAALEAELALAAEASVDRLNLQEQLITLLKEQELDNAELTANERILIERKAAKEIAELRKGFLNEINNTELAGVQAGTRLYYEQQRIAIQEERGRGLITEEQYQYQLEQLHHERLQKELQDLQDYSTSIEGIEQEIARKQVEIDDYVTNKQIENQNRLDAIDADTKAKQAQRLAEQMALTDTFVDGMVASFAGALTEQGMQAKQFSKNMILLTVDMLERIVTMQMGGAITMANMNAFATWDSAATGGIAGAIKAAALTLAIKGFFQVFKASIAQYADGGFEDHQAQIADNSRIRIWAEPETGGEAYIPLAPEKRSRSLKIWEETGKRLGVPVGMYADGGISSRMITAPVVRSQQVNQHVVNQIQVAMENMPRPLVEVSKINEAQNSVNNTIEVTNI